MHASTTFEGVVRLDGTLNPIDGEIVTRELDRLERELYLADQAAGTIRRKSERMAAALVEMAARSASTPAGARRPRPLFTVVMGDESLQRLCELGSGTVLAPGVLLPAMTEADVETFLFDGPTTIVSASPARSFTGRLRRAIQVRDRHCQHPSGCDVPAERCDVDHIVPHAAGGPTDQFNARLECPTHNRDADRHDHGARAAARWEVTRFDEWGIMIRHHLRLRYPSGHRRDGRRRRDDPDEPAA